MFTTKSRHESIASAFSNCKQQSDLKALKTDQYPTENHGEEDGYGEEEIQNLCKRFKLNNTKISNCFRGYVEANSPSRVPKDLISMLNCTKPIPCSSSECERSFSLISEIMTDLRTRFLTRHVSSLIFIKQHIPSINE
ncbi:unnamed protein product [Diabrotica balteata]|uniref:HAT C-terminal dimerisation domain-containing protein n=1 Tax=Diabrotica balteata TaxID=107213 RepID=A0A9N9SP13_DIABA|nr:unnamed protein product [Diabrotica balteata]